MKRWVFVLEANAITRIALLATLESIVPVLAFATIAEMDQVMLRGWVPGVLVLPADMEPDPCQHLYQVVTRVAPYLAREVGVIFFDRPFDPMDILGLVARETTGQKYS